MRMSGGGGGGVNSPPDDTALESRNSNFKEGRYIIYKVRPQCSYAYIPKMQQELFYALNPFKRLRTLKWICFRCF